MGRPSDDDWAPHFACKAVGDALLKVMAGRPAVRLTVLSGHTHGGGESDMAENIHVITGPAQYYRPVVQRIFEFDV